MPRGGKLGREASLWGKVLEADDGIKWGRGLSSISGSLLSSWGWGGQSSLGVIKGEAEGEWSVVGDAEREQGVGRSEQAEVCQAPGIKAIAWLGPSWTSESWERGEKRPHSHWSLFPFPLLHEGQGETLVPTTDRPILGTVDVQSLSRTLWKMRGGLGEDLCSDKGVQKLLGGWGRDG